MTERIKLKINSQNVFSLLSCYAAPCRVRSSEIRREVEFLSIAVREASLGGFRHLIRKLPETSSSEHVKPGGDYEAAAKTFANAISIFSITLICARLQLTFTSPVQSDPL